MVSIAFWVAHVAASEVAGRVAGLAFCRRYLGVWTDPWCNYPDAGSGAVWLLALGFVGFFVGLGRFERWARVYFYVAYELALFTWAAGVAFVPRVPFVVQVVVPLIAARYLSRHVRRLESGGAGTHAERGSAEA